ncbi:MAG: hypothetical protein KDK28_19040, partial [Maritimibacter sp.]|nr:hypothetical protein [Maritimibacter sp.]
FDDAIEDAVEAETPETAADAMPEAEPDAAPEIAQEAAPPAHRADAPEDRPPLTEDRPAPAALADEVAPVAEDPETSPPDAPQDQIAEDHAPVFDGATPDVPAETAAQDRDLGETLTPGTGDTPLDDTLEALEFRAHEAEPDTSEGPEAAMDAGVPDATTHTSAPDAPTAAIDDDAEERAEPVLEAPDPGRETASPPAAIETAQDTAPDTAADVTPDMVPDAAPDEMPAAGSDDDAEAVQDTAPPAGEAPALDDAPEPASAAAPPAPARPEPVTPPTAPAPGPDLVLPDIGPDPEDDAAQEAAPAVAARLRHGRPLTHRAATPRRLNPALIQAYADRLQALSGRLGATPDTRRPF